LEGKEVVVAQANRVDGDPRVFESIQANLITRMLTSGPWTAVGEEDAIPDWVGRGGDHRRCRVERRSLQRIKPPVTLSAENGCIRIPGETVVIVRSRGYSRPSGQAVP
jgi:hypothetical protein